MTAAAASAVKSADRVLDLLELLSLTGRDMSHVQIAESLDIPKSSLSQLLKTLSARGYLEFIPVTRTYKLGDVVSALGRKTSFLDRIINYALPDLTYITEATRETSSLAILNGDVVESVAAVSSPQPLLMHLSVGDRAPLYATSAGKALLAHMSEEKREDYLSRVDLIPLTPKGRHSGEQLRGELDSIRTAGFAFSREETTLGVASMGCLVPTGSPEVFATLNIAAPVLRFDAELVSRAQAALQQSARSLADRLKE